jgi:hypothetical protein
VCDLTNLGLLQRTWNRTSGSVATFASAGDQIPSCGDAQKSEAVGKREKIVTDSVSVREVSLVERVEVPRFKIQILNLDRRIMRTHSTTAIDAVGDCMQLLLIS